MVRDVSQPLPIVCPSSYIAANSFYQASDMAFFTDCALNDLTIMVIGAQVGENKARPCERERQLGEYRERESLKGDMEEKVLPFDKCICFSSNNIL